MQITLEVTPALLSALTTGMDACSLLMDTAPQGDRGTIARDRVALRGVLDQIRQAQALVEDAELKLAKLNELCPTEVHKRDGGSFYCAGILREIAQVGYSLLITMYGNGTTREEAINDDFTKMTTLPEDWYIVIDAMGPDRKHFRWNGERSAWDQIG